MEIFKFIVFTVKQINFIFRHEDLLDAGGEYASMWAEQLKSNSSPLTEGTTFTDDSTEPPPEQ